MDKKISLSTNIYALTNQYPEIIEIMKSLGFEGITNQATLQTAGRVMTIPSGCRMKGIDLTEVLVKLQQAGFEVTQ